MNFYKSYQPILRYLYTEIIKRKGEISLHRHLDRLKLTRSFLGIKGNLAARLSRKLRLLAKSIFTGSGCM